MQCVVDAAVGLWVTRWPHMPLDSFVVAYNVSLVVSKNSRAVVELSSVELVLYEVLFAMTYKANARFYRT